MVFLFIEEFRIFNLLQALGIPKTKL